MNRATLRQIARGCGHVPGYGEHPGTVPLVMLIVAGGLAGLERGVLGGLVGALLMAAVFGPVYLYGAYTRGKARP
jgi:hypothetical protein